MMRSQPADALAGSMLNWFAQLRKTFDQGSPASGSRERKSRYCWRTKNAMPALSPCRIGFGLFGASLSKIVIVAIAGVLSVAPEGFERASWNVSGPSAIESSMIGIESVFVVSPAAKESVPTTVAKSQRA